MVVKRKPWNTLDECIAVLTARRDALTCQIAALSAPTTDRDMLLLLQYLVVGNKKKVAQWANAQGWQLTGVSGLPRDFRDKDIQALFDHPPEGVDPDLMALVHDIAEQGRDLSFRAGGY